MDESPTLRVARWEPEIMPVVEIPHSSDPLASEVEEERRRLAERLARLRGRYEGKGEKKKKVKEVSDPLVDPPKRRSHSTPPPSVDKDRQLGGDPQLDLFALDESPRTLKYEVGAAVEARWQAGSIFYRGKIAATSDGNRFTVAYDDGTIERDVVVSHVRPLAADAQSRSRSEIRDEICKFYRTHNPAKLESVDTLLDRCGVGNEEALLQAIQKKYTSRPMPPFIAQVTSNAIDVALRAKRAAEAAAATAGIHAIYAAKKPDKLREVDQLIRRAGGPQDLLAAVKCAYYPPSKTRVTSAFASRGRVVEELVRSEDEFALRLRTLDERIAQPLRNAGPSRKVDRGFVDTVLKLVAECEGLSQLSDKLRADLHAALSGDLDTCRVGVIFKRFGPFFKMFAAYARRFQDSVQARAYLSRFFEDELDVSGALSAPVERLRDYERLLDELVRLTSPAHPDAGDADAALSMVRDALRHVDQTLQGDVAFKRLVQILEPSSLSALLDVPTRKLVKEGSLVEIKYGPTGGRLGVRRLRAIALSDRLLLVTLPAGENKRRRARQSPLSTKKDLGSSVVVRAAKGRLAYNIAIEHLNDIGPCTSVYSPRSKSRIVYDDDEELDDDSVLDDDSDRLFRFVARSVTGALVFRVDTPEIRDDWLRTLRNLKDQATRRPTNNGVRPPLLLRRHSDPRDVTRLPARDLCARKQVAPPTSKKTTAVA